MDLAQLVTQQANLRVQCTVLEELEELGEADLTEILHRLSVTVLEPAELYQIIEQFGMDKQALLLMRNTNYSDALAIQRHWDHLLRSIIDGEVSAKFVFFWSVRNRRELLQTTVVDLGQELGVTSSVFFPLPFLTETLVSFGIVSFPANSDVSSWLLNTLIPAGVSYEAVIDTLYGLIHAREEARWRITVSDLYCRSIQAYSDFIVFKNIDPTVKARFMANADHYVDVLNRVKEEVKEEKAGDVATKRDETVDRVDKLLKTLETQKKREKSVLYGQMLVWIVR